MRLEILEWASEGRMRARLLVCEREDEHHHALSKQPEIQRMPDGCLIQVSYERIPNARPDQ
jgi:hypothetical protein